MAEEFSSPQWRRLAAASSEDFPTYAAWVRGFAPSLPHWWCEECGASGLGEPPTTCPAVIVHELTGEEQSCGSTSIEVVPSHLEVINERLLRGDRLELVLGPPDSGKSQLGVCYAEWTLGKDPNFRWLIASEVAGGIASTIVTEIGETIAMNERYHAVFGHLQDPTGKAAWSTHSIRLRTLVTPQEARRLRQPPTPPPPFPWLTARGRRPGLSHPNVKAVGWRTGYTGLRAEGLLADDLVSDRVSRSQKLSEQVFNTLHQKMLARLTTPPRPLQVPGVRYNRAVLFGQHWAPRDVYTMIREVGCVTYDSNPERAGLEVLDPEWAEVAA